jgi:hypothetical protein
VRGAFIWLFMDIHILLKLGEFMGKKPKECPLCNELCARRIRCNICNKLVCKLCILTTVKDMGGPLCSECS